MGNIIQLPNDKNSSESQKSVDKILEKPETSIMAETPENPWSSGTPPDVAMAATDMTPSQDPMENAPVDRVMATSETPKKPRGRPPKRPRGRPPKNKTPVQSSSAHVDAKHRTSASKIEGKRGKTKSKSAMKTTATKIKKNKPQKKPTNKKLKKVKKTA